MIRFRLIQGGATPPTSFSDAAAQLMLPAEGDDRAVYADQILRRQWSQERLRGEGVPINLRLPVIDGEKELRLRSPDEVADRALALTIVAAKATGLPQLEVERIVEERGAFGLFSPLEQTFIDETEPDAAARDLFSTRYEAAWTLLWSLRQIREALGRPEERCAFERLADTILDVPDLARHGLRPANEILNEADLVYRYHWAVGQAERDGEAPPTGLDPAVVRERHLAFAWLTCPYGDGWDEAAANA